MAEEGDLNLTIDVFLQDRKGGEVGFAEADSATRGRLLAAAKTQLMRNISTVEDCEKELQSTVEALCQHLSRYQGRMNAKLAEIKEDIERRVNQAVSEVTTALTHPSPQLKSGLASLIWHGEPAELFSFRINSESICNLIESLVDFSLQLPSDRPAQAIEMEQDWKPDPNPPKSCSPLHSVPDFLTARAKACMARLGPYSYPLDILEGDPMGPIELLDGSVYTGQWRNGKRYGKGQLMTSAGALLEGYWNSGLHLHGRHIYPSGDYYEGGFCHMKREGQGHFQSFDMKAAYTGAWSNGRKQGKGQELLADGSVYTGDFELDKKSGRGVFKWPNKEYYEGEFKDMRIEGFGKYVWADNKWYEGQWKDGKMHGRGKQVNEGKEYEGEFHQDKKQGYGVLRWEGNVYEGEWVSGQMHGKGFLTLRGRERRQFLFQHNKKVEEIT